MEDFPAHIWPQTQQLFQSTSAYCPKLENPALCSNQLYLMKSRYFSMWWCVRSVASDSAALWTVACQALCPWDSPGKNTGVGCHALLQGIFLTQGLNLYLLSLLHQQVDSLPLVPWGVTLITSIFADEEIEARRG